jgi:hypothetical protein
VIQLQPVPIQVQRPAPQPVAQPMQLQLVPIQAVAPVPQPLQWEGGTTIAVPVTIRLGVGQAVASSAPTYLSAEQLTTPTGPVQACNAAGQCVPCPCTLRYNP